MKGLANIVLWAGILALVVGLILRLATRQLVLGLIPSSFLEFSVACFVLAIAMVVVGKEGK